MRTRRGAFTAVRGRPAALILARDREEHVRCPRCRGGHSARRPRGLALVARDLQTRVPRGQTYMPTHLTFFLLMSNSSQTHLKLMSHSSQTHLKLMSEMVNGFRKNVICIE